MFLFYAIGIVFKIILEFLFLFT
ncbi:hypothetical protein KL86CLO1_11722 [uncultured Eubacteriales bacterium]|uniref:Uncharacterized protein n=1 Tax=uncultured Eubacteriales bacterium TaxID=172733 RepID=A0A212JU52_9FIRM|nr:hypothetical protein KL86CLO1_11722 [uncultured Eubacteriales bacterium]